MRTTTMHITFTTKDLKPVHEEDDEKAEHDISDNVDAAMHKLFRQCVKDAITEDAIMDATGNDDEAIVEGFDSFKDYGLYDIQVKAETKSTPEKKRKM